MTRIFNLIAATVVLSVSAASGSPLRAGASLAIPGEAKLDPALRRIVLGAPDIENIWFDRNSTGFLSPARARGDGRLPPVLPRTPGSPPRVGTRAPGGPGRPHPDLPRRFLLCHVALASTQWGPPVPGVTRLIRAGDVGLVAAPPEVIPSLAAAPDVEAIELAFPMSFKNDVATVETGARSARAAFAATGRGVILGFIGSGADVAHPDFLDSDGKSRILYLLDLSEPGDTNGNGLLDGPDYFGGTLYTKAQIDSAIAGLRPVPGADRRGHETHVMGVAAGNGDGTGNGFPAGTFAGVAPEADLVVVKSSLADVGFVGPGEASAGLAFIDSVAAALGLPYVVNMSFGTHLSAHDGTSLEERFIDNTVGRGVPGKAVVVSAGNEGSNYGDGPLIHCSKTLAGGDTTYCTVRVAAYTPEPGGLNDGIILDMWYDGAARMTVTVRSPGGESLEVRKGESRSLNGDDGSVFIDNATFPDPLNADSECFIQIDDGAGVAPAPGDWSVEIAAAHGTTGGRFDIWRAFSSGLGGEPTFTADSPVTNEALVATPGNAHNAITVGSYVNKESWTDIDNNTIFFDVLGVPPAGAIAPGSSPGPTRDGRMKPELTAPGRAVTSTLSAGALPDVSDVSIFAGCPGNAPRCTIAGDGRHAVARGTSFAAAHVAGAAALLLELKPDLDSEEIRNALALTARPKAVLGGPWGYGALDVLGAAGVVSGAEVFELAGAVYTADGVLVSWRIAEGQEVEDVSVTKATQVQGPYGTVHTSADREGTFLDVGVGPEQGVFYRLVAGLAEGAQAYSIPIVPAAQPGGASIALLPLFPNPARATTTVRFVSSAAGTATLRAYDVMGRLVGQRRVTVPRPGATVNALWPWIRTDGTPLASGVYTIVVEVAGARRAAKAVVLR